MDLTIFISVLSLFFSLASVGLVVLAVLNDRWVKKQLQDSEVNKK